MEIIFIISYFGDPFLSSLNFVDSPAGPDEDFRVRGFRVASHREILGAPTLHLPCRIQ